MTRLLVILCLLPGAAITVYAMTRMYQAMGSGGDVDEQKLREGVNMGLQWTMIGLGVAIGLLVLRVIFRLLRPRRRME